jgi:FHS family L-fucose permease-like MFS transporter
VIRYAMQNLHFDDIISSLGANASSEQIISALRGVEPVAGGFYSFCDFIGLDVLLPRTAEQAGATYYIMSLCLFVICRFLCTWLMKYFKPRKMLSVFACMGVIFCLGTVFLRGFAGVYCLMAISGCLSLMFPTIYGIGIKGLGDDTKMGGSGMVMAIAGASVLTQIEGFVSDQSGEIAVAYLVPAVAFAIILYYAAVFCRKQEKLESNV